MPMTPRFYVVNQNNLYEENRFERLRRSLALLGSTPKRIASSIFALALCFVLAGCGSGGYPGSGITGVSTSTLTLDAGQSYEVTATIGSNLPVAWSLSGANCSGSSCGTLSSATGASTTYTAPSGITSQMNVTLLAVVSGTKSQQTVAITVNPDPTISGTLPGGVIGSAYTGTLTTAGGTGPLSLSVASGALPPGLALNTTTGALTGTPTTIGTYTFTAQLTDSSIVPYTVKAQETITISAPTLTLTTTTLPNGTVNVPYTATIGVSGGVSPYSCSITNGTLPAGLTLNGCVVSGTPTTAGASTITVKATDSANPADTTTGPETITIAPAALSLTTTTLPNGTVNVPYTATIGVSGGVSPYSCAITSGTLPAGLKLTGCVVSGTPTTAGASTVTVKATDSASPVDTTTGPETITIAPAPLSLTTTTLPNGTVNVPYTATIGVSGGVSPYSCAITNGTLPAGLKLTGCVVSGTPTTAGASTVTVKATDSANPVDTTTGPETITIAPAPLTLTTSTLPDGTVNVPYSAPISVSGGVSPYACTITSGTLPAGLTLTGCTVSGTPTTAGTSTVTVKATDSANPVDTTTGPQTITIVTAGSLTIGSLPNGTVNVAYSSAISTTGGTAPYTCSITSGTLPAGLKLTGCTVSGTPTTAGSSTATVKVTDSSTPAAKTTSKAETITIAPAPLTLTNTTLPNGTVNVPYTATIGVSGGVTPYACSITVGTLPAGLKLTGCTVSGTPTTPGASTVTVKVTDGANPVDTTSGPETITIAPAPLTLTSTTLPNGTVNVPYTATIGVSGGVTPYACSITAGTLPAGLKLTGCTVSGTPTTPGASTVTVKVTDGANPVDTTSGPETITIAPAPLTLTNTTLPNGTVNVPYTATIGVSGGVTPYACSITAGTLPAGLKLTGCTVSGTPTTPGASTVTVKVTDGANPVDTTSGPETITIAPAPLTLTSTKLPNGTVNVPYSATIGVSGGVSPYSCTITAGTLPAGLILNGCTVTGTPTTAGSSTVTVNVSDSNSPTDKTSGPETIVISPAALTLTNSTLPDGTVNIPYSATIGTSGGVSPYSCAITSGTLPAGLTLTGCTVSGTPTTAGVSTVTVKVTDSANPVDTTSGPETITINPADLTLTTSTLPNGKVNVPYSAPIGTTGGTTPYSCTITSGTLPAGLALTGCTVSGTPTTAETSTVTVKVTDSSKPVKTVTGPQTITIEPAAALSLTATLPDAIKGTAYSYQFQATGGITPYSYTQPTGALPPGITLASDGLLSGTPTQVGAYSFNVTVTDSSPTPQSVTIPLVLLVRYPSGPNNGELKGPYAYLFQGYDDVVLGVLAYQTANVGSFTADGTGGISAGELDSNHQSSTPSGTTVSSQQFLGTYQINADNRGLITITTLHTDGTVNQTITYAISLKAPVAPATVSSEGSLIEFDNDQFVGTKGSGTLLAQTTSAFTAGLSGSYAFGLSGDTPCLISCTVGLLSGPVAAVGRFTADSGGITDGVSDANIASTNYSDAPLSGSYEPADTNGRVQLTMTNASINDGVYPTDYAVYIVNANEAFVMSTDKHSAYTLLAGTARLQTESTFSNASMNGPFIGYENAQSNPGLLGVTLQGVLNFSTATVFRADGNGSGSCNTTNIDTGGLTSLVDGLTGLGNKDLLLQALLGVDSTTGNAPCSVSGNGRGEIQYPAPNGLISTLLGLLGLPTGAPSPRVTYLVSPNDGYFLESGYAGLGQIEPQTGAPFSLATLNGTYVEGSIPASSLASINTSGYFKADGKGGITYTDAANIGVGTINVLSFTTTTNSTYSLSDPTPNATTTAASAGRYVLNDGTTVIYAISPTRFVVIDTNPLTTSPGVSLAY